MTVESQLDTLEAKGLISLAAYQPELEYLFRHWLVQDAAYGSLLKQERRLLHGLVGEALENLYPDKAAELSAVLAMHFEGAGEADKAVDYLLAAGGHALARNAIREAYDAFARAGDLLPAELPDEDDVVRAKRVQAALGKARASLSFGQSEGIVAALEMAERGAEQLGQPQLVAQVLATRALTLLQRGESPTHPSVKQALDRVREIGQQLGDESLTAIALALTGLNQVFTGPIRDGVQALEQAVPLLQKRQDIIGAAFARGALAMGYAELGEFEKADEAAANAMELAEGGDLIAKLDAQIAYSMVRATRGDLEGAAPVALDCVTRAEETGAFACVMPSAWVLGDIYHRQGRYEEARQILKRASDIAASVDRRLMRPTIQGWLGSTASALGDTAAAKGNWDEALATTRATGNRFGEASILAKRGQELASRGDAESALADFDAAAAVLEAEGARPFLARVLRGWGETLRATGRREEGDEKLRRALELFEDMGISVEAQAVRLALAGGEPLKLD